MCVCVHLCLLCVLRALDEANGLLSADECMVVDRNRAHDDDLLEYAFALPHVCDPLKHPSPAPMCVRPLICVRCVC